MVFFRIVPRCADCRMLCRDLVVVHVHPIHPFNCYPVEAKAAARSHLRLAALPRCDNIVALFVPADQAPFTSCLTPSIAAQSAADALAPEQSLETPANHRAFRANELLPTSALMYTTAGPASVCCAMTLLNRSSACSDPVPLRWITSQGYNGPSAAQAPD